MSARIEDIKEVETRGETLPTYYECGCCGSYHPTSWDGDCRDDANRYALDQLDAKHGAFGWLEVDQPDGLTALDHAEFTGAVANRLFREGKL